MNLSEWAREAQELNPRSVGSFLGSHGWVLVTADRTKEVWAPSDIGSGAPKNRLMLPLDRSFSDFALRFGESLRYLADVYSWDWNQLSTGIVNATSDFMYIRADQMIDNASIPFRQAESLITGAGGLLFAAARSTLNPRPHFSGRQPIAAQSFMENDVRMGHTKRGSFIITILTKLDDPLDIPEYTVPVDAGQLDPQPVQGDGSLLTPVMTVVEPPSKFPPFQRRVMSTLARGLATTYELARDSGSVRVDEAAGLGVSSNLVSSLEDMTQFAGLRALDLSFSWSADKEISHPDLERVVLDRDVIPELPALNERLRVRTLESHTETIFGVVTRLELEDDGGGDAGIDDESGIITVRGVTGKAKQQQARVRLEGSQYDAAWRAHRSRGYVSITGTLEKRGRFMWLTGPIHLTEGVV